MKKPSTIVITQYWLLTASMEALLAGNRAMAIPMLLASVFCLILVVGLILTGESGARRLEGELKKDS